MKTILYNPIFINPQAYYVFPRLTRYLQPDNESTAEPANYIGTIEVKVIAYGDTTLKRTYTNTDSIDLSEFKNTWIRISLFTKVGSCVLGEWKIGNMESDLPYIDPEVLASLKAVVIVGNKTNNDSDRAIVKNLVDPDNSFVISNAAYEGISGYNGYPVVFGIGKTYGGMPSTDDFAYTVSPTTVNVTKFNITHGFIYSYLKRNGELETQNSDYPSYKIKVTGLEKGFGLHYSYLKNPSDANLSAFGIGTDGTYTIPKSFASDGSLINNNVWIGFIFTGTAPESCNVTIEVLPEYEGAFVTDGVEDLITSTKTVQEMGITDEVTVVSMIHQIDKPSNFITTNNIRTSGSVVGRNAISLTDKTGIYGWYKDNIQGSTINVINNILGDKADYTASASSNTNLSSKFSVVGYISNGSIVETSQVAWYWTIIANKVLTTDQINQVIAYFNLDRTLKPDILCNVKKQGITNDNHAEFGDKLIDFSGNGRDIQLNNIAWKGDSGIGKYEVDFLDSSIWNSSNSTITSSKIDCKNAISHIMLLYYSVGSKEYPDIPSFKVIKTGADIDYSYIDETGFPKSVKIVDGENVLPASHNTLYSGSGRFCGFGNPGMGNSVTITQIPSHAGALCLDGVNDFGKVTGMPIYKDYTFIIDREIISIGNTNGIVASKSEDSTDVNKQGAFLFEYLGAPNNISAWSFYKDNGKVANTDFTRGISYQSKYSYNGIELLAGTALDSDKLWLGILRDKDSRFANVAIYSLMSFPYSMSEFLIERQLKKYKLGTLYPNMVEFRPIIKANDNYKIFYTAIFPLTGDIWERINIGDYVPVGRRIAIQMSFDNEAKKLVSAVSSQLGNITIVKNSKNIGYTIFGDVLKDKSPQKISITIEQDENYVLFNPVINSNYDNYKLTFHLREYEKLINIGDYIPKGTYIRANLYLKNDIDELVTFTFNGVNIDYAKSPVLDTAYNIRQIYNYDSPQEVNIIIDEYIKYENIDFTNCYPGVPRIYVNDKSVTWGDKLKVGDEFTFYGNVNILPEMYNVLVKALYNGEEMVYGSIGTISKSMVFTSFKTYLLDNNEPKCILSPRLLRIPNSSYKILGYIPDISGHGNHGVIHNSAYAEGSGVNEDGSYQFDGVDDFVTIPTTVGGKQVLMKVNWDDVIANAIIYDQRGYPDEFAIYNADKDNSNNPVFAYQARNTGQTYIDGILNSNIKASELKAITHNITITNELSAGVNKFSPVIGSNRVHDAYFTNMALYDFMLFDNISTDDKIKQLNEYVGIEGNTEWRKTK